MNTLAMKTTRAFPNVIRTIAILLSVVIALIPLRLGADCCGGASDPECEGKPCGDKETGVYYTLSVGTGASGSATIVGKYEDDGTVAFEQTVHYPAPGDSSGCGANMECGFFCAKDNRNIILSLSARGNVCGYYSLNAVFTANYGCSGSVSLQCGSDEWDFVSNFQSARNEGNMTTGESNGCSTGSCPLPPAGSGAAENGSVHFEWELGRPFDQGPSLSKRLRNYRLPKMLLSLNDLTGVNWTPEAMLRIPTDTYRHRVIFTDGDNRLHGMEYSATDAKAPVVLNSEIFNWLNENPTLTFGSVQTDDKSPFPQCERLVVGGKIKQVRTADCLAVFEQLAGSFRIKFYYPGQFIVPPNRVPGTSLYLLNVNQVPKYTWLVDKPNATSIRVKEAPGAPEEKATVWTQVAGGWEMAEDNGSRIESKKMANVTLPGGGAGTTKTIEIRNAAGDVLSRQVSTFDAYHRLVASSDGKVGEEITTEYRYPADPLGEMEWMKRSDGYFERYSQVGNKITLPYTKLVVRPWLDRTFADATAGNARVTETLTEAIGGGRRVTITEKIEGTVVSKSVQSSLIQFPDPTLTGALYGNVRNQQVQITASQRFARDASGALVAGGVSTRISFAAGASSRLAGRLIKETNEDGTGVSVHYDMASESGGGYTAAANGTYLQIVTERNVRNSSAIPAIPAIPGRTTKEIQYELDDGTVRYEELWVLPTVGPEVRVKRTFHTYDEKGRRTGTTVSSENIADSRMTYQASYSGDLLTSETDETGVTTAYSNYDDAGNAWTVTRQALLPELPALVTSRVFDSLGRVTSETQSGAGVVPRSRTSEFDSRGRTKIETANGLTTNFAYAVGTETRTAPDTGAITTTYFNDGQVKQVSGPGVVTTNHAYNIVNGLVRGAVTRGAGAETVTQIGEHNGSGQAVRQKIAAPGNAWRIYNYDPAGRLSSEWIDGTRTRAVGYDDEGKGSVSETVFAEPGPARTFGTTEAFVKDGPIVWHERRSSDGSYSRERMNPGALLSATQSRAANGRTSTTTAAVNVGSATVTATTVDSAVSNPSISISRGGVGVSSTSAEKPAATTYSYDALGRPVTVTDGATLAVTTVTYEPATGQVLNTTTTSAGSATSTVNEYFSPAETAAGQIPGRLKQRTVDGVATTYRYTPRGELAEVNGATYPLKYVYDNAGRLKYLHTYRAEPGTTLGAGDVTEWVYEAGTTLLHQKKDAANAGPVYAYDAWGRLQTRTWARTVGGQPLTTTYTYNLAGDMKHIDYSDSTPDVELGYDARGRLVSRTDGMGTTALRYHGETGAVADEVGSDGSRLHREVDGVGRETGYYLWDGQRFATWGGWGYDPATGRVNGALTAAGWVEDVETKAANSVSRTVELLGTNVRTKTQRDGLGRLQSLSTLVGTATPTPLAGRRYEYNGAGRVTTVREGNTTDGGGTWTDADRWDYGYNGRGEVNTAGRTRADGNMALGAGFGYAFDAIGNRITATREDTIADTFTTPDNPNRTNNLNQYTLITRGSGAGVVRGEVAPGSQVTVNGGAVMFRGGNYFADPVEAAPGNDPQWLSVTVTEQRTINGLPQSFAQEGQLFWPGRAEAPLHDADGNLTLDARWTYTWDAENRLVAMETRWLQGEVAGLPVQRLEFSYDGLGRRVVKRVMESVGGNSWSGVRTLHFAYDGWNLIAESQPLGGGATSQVLRTYQWSTDLSGSRQGAGGVGGLLLINTHTASGTIQSYYPCYGDNGNIAALLDVSDPQAGVAVAAAYEYGPFGEPLRATGVMARLNPFRFSTKYQDEETGLVYYGYRFYAPHIGRWINRDPIEEGDGANVYAFTWNNTHWWIDVDGRRSFFVWRPVAFDPSRTAPGFREWRPLPPGRPSYLPPVDTSRPPIDVYEDDPPFIHDPETPIRRYPYRRPKPTPTPASPQESPIPRTYYRYDAAKGKTSFGPGTDVTNRRDLTWSEAISITYFLDIKCLYVYSLVDRGGKVDAHPAGPLVMGKPQFQMKGTISAPDVQFIKELKKEQ